MREVLCLGTLFGFGGVWADVCNPMADECQEPLEAVGGQLTERDFRPQAGQVRFTVEPAPHRSRTLSLPSHISGNAAARANGSEMGAAGVTGGEREALEGAGWESLVKHVPGTRE